MKLVSSELIWTHMDKSQCGRTLIRTTHTHGLRASKLVPKQEFTPAQLLSCRDSHILLFSLMILVLGSHFTIPCVCYSLPILEETVCILSPTLYANIISRKFFKNSSLEAIYYGLTVIWLQFCKCLLLSLLLLSVFCCCWDLIVSCV